MEQMIQQLNVLVIKKSKLERMNSNMLCEYGDGVASGENMMAQFHFTFMHVYILMETIVFCTHFYSAI